jgi:hypothetical protein
MPNKLAKKSYAGSSAMIQLKWVRSAICAVTRCVQIVTARRKPISRAAAKARFSSIEATR